MLSEAQRPKARSEIEARRFNKNDFQLRRTSTAFTALKVRLTEFILSLTRTQHARKKLFQMTHSWH
jgi:hypothetical protein